MSSPPERSYRGRVLRRSRVPGGLFLLPIGLLLGMAAYFGLLGYAGVIGPLLLFAAMLSVLAMGSLRSRRLGSSAVGTRAQAKVEDAAFVAETSDTIYRLPRAAIRRGYLVRNVEDGTVLVLEGPLRVLLEFWLPSLDDGRALLEELKLSPLTSPQVFRFFFGLEVIVGVDGVVIGVPLLGRKRFVAHSRIDDVRWTGEHVRLLLKDGSSVEIATGTRGEHDALVERLLHARDAFRAAEGAEPIALLARAGRDTERWVKETRALGNVGSGYRATALPEETLWRIALDPSEKQDLRIGASLALGPKLDETGRERLKEAAGAAASPRVRVALSAVAETEDETALVEALEEGRKNPR